MTPLSLFYLPNDRGGLKIPNLPFYTHKGLAKRQLDHFLKLPGIGFVVLILDIYIRLIAE